MPNPEQCGVRTHGGSVRGRAGRSRPDRKPGIGRPRRSARAAGSHTTGTAGGWSMWRRRGGRLSEEGKIAKFLELKVRH